MAKDRSYFVSELTAQSLRKKQNVGIRLLPASIFHLDPGYSTGAEPKITGYTIAGSIARIQAYRRAYRLKTYGSGYDTKRKKWYTILVPRALRNVTTIEYVGPSAFHSAPSIVKDLDETLGVFAKITGHTFHLHLCDGGSLPSFQKEDGVVHIVLGASAPGSPHLLESTRLCGVLLNAHNFYISRQGVSPGRGVVVTEEEGYQIGQIIDATIYMLLPARNTENILLLGSKSGPGLFKRAFGLVWNTYSSGKRPSKSTPITTLEAYGARMERELSLYPTMVKKSLGAIEDDIGRTNKQLYDLFEQKRRLLLLEGHIRATHNMRIKQFREEWQQLTEHPLIRRIYEVDSALFVETKIICQEHGGVLYQMGAYTIRYIVGSPVSVWSHNPLHPHRIAHPHISPKGVVCFGNVSVPIQEASAEGCFSDVVSLVLRWLTEGYDHELADTKITEWPRRS